MGLSAILVLPHSQGIQASNTRLYSMSPRFSATLLNFWVRLRFLSSVASCTANCNIWGRPIMGSSTSDAPRHTAPISLLTNSMPLSLTSSALALGSLIRISASRPCSSPLTIIRSCSMPAASCPCGVA